MKKRRETCKYCESKLDFGTTRREFCSPKCKVYWGRENKGVLLNKHTLAPVQPDLVDFREINYATPVVKSFDGPKTDYTTKDEIGQWSEPKMAAIGFSGLLTMAKAGSSWEEIERYIKGSKIKLSAGQVSMIHSKIQTK